MLESVDNSMVRIDKLFFGTAGDSDSSDVVAVIIVQHKRIDSH